MPTDSLAYYGALVSTYSQFNNIIAIYQETVIPAKNIGFLDKNQTSVVLWYQLTETISVISVSAKI